MERVAIETGTPVTPDGQRDGWLRGKLRNLRDQKEAVKKDPLWGTVFVIVVAVLTWSANELWQNWKESHRDPDKQLIQIQETQKQEFAALREGLAALSGSVPAASRGDLEQIKDALGGIEAQNEALVDMLALAREENDRVRKLAEAKTGIRGGYDLILTENSGVQLDAVNQLGLGRVSTSWVKANLTSRKGVQSKSLNSGESIAYDGADGRPCRATLLSIKERRAASFAISCG